MDDDTKKGFALFNQVLDAIQELLLTNHNEIEALEKRVAKLEGK